MTITFTLHLKKDKIESKLKEEIRNRLLYKKSLRVINAVMFDIDKHEKEIIAVYY